MAFYKRPRYNYFIDDEQAIKQENEAEVEIENEQENEAKNKTGQNDQNFAKVYQSAQNINVTAAGNGQLAPVTQANGADVNGTSQGQSNDQDPINVPIVVPVNNADQAGQDLTD